MKTKLTEKCFKGMDGAYAAMFTPYGKDGKVSVETIGRLVEHGIGNGLTGFYITGTTGEWWLLSQEERKTVMRATVEAVKGRAKVIAHVGANCTDDSVALAKYAADIGIDWISSLAPQLYRKSFEGAMYHYRKVSEATDLPFMVYSMDAALNPERDVRMFDLKNVKGIKYTGRDYFAAQCLKRKVDRETIWFAGCDEQLLCGLSLGNVFAGGIGSSYNIIPGHYARICALAKKGDLKSAAKWQDEANQVVELMIENDNWTYRKLMMKRHGIDCGPFRKPFEPVSPAAERAFLKRFDRLLKSFR